ncbi:nucleoside transporter [SCandidatus Aminicenantes bacterium Aminicenantia_JdfR_composite]|jgi:CNT family concentrative nucleoside transporter|nr:nucleoside transporter [SCandidatus Aminicenantes bacterium Aminicenantia_JdfR_composite]MCP2605811.1 nucleoside transporter [Candidatus Aminicenantes bacterium AC-335-O07]MCP2606474.1 nucleoside transporter [Candidatus Aminicenantes bacterium AC-708-I09]
MELYNLVSFAGIFVLMAFAWLLSANRRIINWKVIIWGVGLQLLFALFIFTVPAGTKIFLAINNIVVKVLDCATAGTKFLFGRLALPPGTTNEAGETSLGFFLAFQALPTVIFFASLVGALYYLKVMPFLIRIFSYVFTKLMRISGAESLCVSSNIFVGIESALTIKPHLNEMTKSELCTILTAGMGTIASSVMALYVFILQKDFPTIAGHLVSASVLSAPACIVMSKLIYPETETPTTLGEDIKPYYEREGNLIEAIINGANSGTRLVVGIATLLLAFLGIVALIDLILGVFGGQLNSWLGLKIDWSLRGLLGYIFYPFTLIIGVPPSDAIQIARVIGERTVATEVQSYQSLAQLLAQGAIHNPRSIVITTYALCGFAHIASLAIFVGGISALAPKRTRDLSRLGFRALLAATLACLMTAAVAGTFFSHSSILLGK